MSSWRPAGPHGSPPRRGRRHDDHPGTLPAPPHFPGSQAPQMFPAAAIARHLASFQTAPSNTRHLPTENTEACHPHHHRSADAASRFTAPWPPTFAPPRPSPSWAVPAMVPRDTGTHGVYSGCTAGAGVGNTVTNAGCLRMATGVGSTAAGGGRNFIVSPLSLHAALALVAAGAKGETQRELLDFLMGPAGSSLAALHGDPAIRLVGMLRGLEQTSFACGVWVARGRALRPEFVEVAGAVYAAVAESVDFWSEPEKARQQVNTFVKHETKELIDEVLPVGSVDSSTVVVLANALYFKGTWAQPFDPSATFGAPFHLADGTTVLAPFMTTSLFQQHVAAFPGFKALKLPYKNGGSFHVHQAALFYMLLLVPDHSADLGLAGLYDKAVSTPDFIRRHTPADQAPVGRFMVPKFKFEFKFEASREMQELGVTRAFGGGDFSGMVTGGNGLRISGVYHSATVEVDELGTVAAAATAVCMQQCGSARPPVDFVADRPFLFAIVEERTGVALFLGHVVNPLDG
ncbi:putative serpin-Z12 [Triticum dicoccoides]|uniref:putative serpin-Z12 n=1 Tax=Triticum dicoccoides TaxID=85692 RepID=UPI001891F1AB|nr:putative serpin-Z12 [Triticum dicoccoides]